MGCEMKKGLLVLLPLTWASMAFLAPPHRLFVIGDSTAAEYPAARAPLSGWAQALQAQCKAESVQVIDKALPGRSSKSFLNEGAWAPIKAALRPGDAVIIQFGHNDAKIEDTTRGTLPMTDYKQYLSIYIDDALAQGAIPVLATSIERNAWSADGKTLLDTHGDYPKAMRELAAARKIGFIDATALTHAHFQAIGKSATTGYFMSFPAGKWPNYPDGSNDNTHLQTAGAHAISRLVAEDIARRKIPILSGWIKSAAAGIPAPVARASAKAIAAGRDAVGRKVVHAR